MHVQSQQHSSDSPEIIFETYNYLYFNILEFKTKKMIPCEENIDSRM